MERQEILNRLALLAGLSAEEALPYAPLADAALAQVEGMLRDDAPDGGERAAYLCGAVCFYKFALLRGGASEETVRALDVSVSKKLPARYESARAVLEDALLLARPLLRDDRFFCGRTGRGG